MITTKEATMFAKKLGYANAQPLGIKDGSLYFSPIMHTPKDGIIPPTGLPDYIKATGEKLELVLDKDFSILDFFNSRYEKLIELAKSEGFSDVKFAGILNGKEYYDLITDDTSRVTGLPRFIEVEGDNIRVVIDSDLDISQDLSS